MYCSSIIPFCDIFTIIILKVFLLDVFIFNFYLVFILGIWRRIILRVVSWMLLMYLLYFKRKGCSNFLHTILNHRISRNTYIFHSFLSTMNNSTKRYSKIYIF